MAGRSAFTSMPRATATNTAGKIRPPRKPQVPATITATSLIPANSASCPAEKPAAGSVSSLIWSRPLNSVIGPPITPSTPRIAPPTTIARNGERRRAKARCACGNAYTAAMAMTAQAIPTAGPVSRSIGAGTPYGASPRANDSPPRAFIVREPATAATSGPNSRSQ